MRTTVVMKLSNSYENSGRKITCHKIFPIIQLGREPLLRKLKIYVTIRKVRMELPTVFTFAKGIKLLCNIYGFQKDVKIVLYCPMKNKSVKLLGTMLNEESIQSYGEKNSEIIQYYISTNGVVDTMNQ